MSNNIFVLCYKIGKNIVLVDAGCDSMDGFVMNNFLLPDKALRQKGISTVDDCIKFLEGLRTGALIKNETLKINDYRPFD